MAVGIGFRERSLLAAGCAVLMLGGGGAGTALAQDQKSASAMNEIIVTTTKREETLQSVPISVGVVTGADVERMSIAGFEQLQNYVPNLAIQETLGSYQIRIRGLGSGASNISFASAVGTFVDGVYCGRPRCFQNPLFDIERVEVVRGPQGALFGKNTIAGAVSTITAGPTDSFEAQVSTGVELSEGGYNLSGVLSGPITDTLGFRIAGKSEYADGFVKNISTGKDENAVNAQLFRGILEWKPTDALVVRLKAEMSKRDYDGYTVQLIGLDGRGGYANFMTGGRPLTQPEKLDWETSTRTVFPDAQFDDTNSQNYALQVDWDMGGGYTLTSITGGIAFDFLRRTSATAYTELFVDTNIQENYEQYSQEFRLLSPTGGFFDYFIGAYWSHDNSSMKQWGPYAFPPFVPDPPGSGLPNDPDTKAYSTNIRNYHGVGDTLSAYASGTFHFLDDRARAILGIRVGQDELDGHSWNERGSWSHVTNSFTPLPDPLGPATGPGNGDAQYSVTSSREDRYTLPSLSLQYDFTDDIMGYVSYAEGFKAGGFVATDPSIGTQIKQKAAANPAWAQNYVGMYTVANPDLLAGLNLKEGNGVWDYKPEKSDSYEIGAKMKFLGGALRWNVDYFYTQFDDLQSSQYDGTRFITKNAAKATSKGVETDLQWRAMDYLTVGVTAAWLNATYDKYTDTFCKIIAKDGTLADPACTNGHGDLSGTHLERAPKFEGSFSLDWDSPLTAGTRLRLNGVASYSGEFDISQNLSPLYRQDSFTKIDLRAAVAGADDGWEIALIGRNITDELTMQHNFQVGRYHAASIDTPRYVFLQGTWKFR